MSQAQNIKHTLIKLVVSGKKLIINIPVLVKHKQDYEEDDYEGLTKLIWDEVLKSDLVDADNIYVTDDRENYYPTLDDLKDNSPFLSWGSVIAHDQQTKLDYEIEEMTTPSQADVEAYERTDGFTILKVKD